MSDDDGYFYEDDSDADGDESLRGSDLDFNTAAELEDTFRQVLTVPESRRPSFPPVDLADMTTGASDLDSPHGVNCSSPTTGAVCGLHRGAAAGTQETGARRGHVRAVHPRCGRRARAAAVQMVRRAVHESSTASRVVVTTAESAQSLHVICWLPASAALPHIMQGLAKLAADATLRCVLQGRQPREGGVVHRHGQLEGQNRPD